MGEIIGFLGEIIGQGTWIMNPQIVRRWVLLGGTASALTLRPWRTAQADTNFTNFSFAATGAPTARTMPDRLSEIINVKDWGAKGDGSTDDSTAIQAAINYCISKGGGKVFFPIGKYHLGTALTVGSTNPAAAVSLIGSGQSNSRGTMLIATLPGFVISQGAADYDNIAYIDGLVVSNGSMTAGAGCIKITGTGVGIRNCYVVGMVGIDASAAVGVSIIDVDGNGGQVNGTSDLGTPDVQLNSSVCVYLGHSCTAINCRFVGGFFICYALSGTGASVIGCSAESGNIAVRIGWSPNGEMAANACSVQGLQTERDTTCIELYNATGCLVQGNVLTGQTGTLGFQNFTGLSWNSVSHVVTATVATAHGLSGTQLLEITANPAAFLNNQTFQNCTPINATQFTFPGSATNPGSFVSGGWKYPLKYAIRCRIAKECAIIATPCNPNAAQASVDLDYAGAASFDTNIMIGVDGTVSGWNVPSDLRQLSGWQFMQVGGTAVTNNSASSAHPNPFGVLVFADLPGQSGVTQTGPIEGQEYGIIDGSKEGQTPPFLAGFSDNVIGGGNGHYKVRYNGQAAKWQRVG